MTSEINHRELFFKPGVSPTSINQFFESPSRFWKYSSYNPNKERKEATPAMIFGRLVHCLILTPEMYEIDFAPEPLQTKDDLDTVDQLRAFILANLAPGEKIPSKANKPDLINIIHLNWPAAPIWSDKIADFHKTLGRRTPITLEQFNQAKSMQDAALANRGMRNLIGNGLSETPYCWFPDSTEENPEAGLMRKVRMDYARNGLVIEYKTDIDPEKEQFSKTIGNMGYHRQLATQVEAATRLYGETPRGAVLIVQDKEMHDDIAIYALNAADIATGHAENQAAMDEIAQRMELMRGGMPEKQAWRSFSDEIQPIELPKWYKAKHIAR